MDHLVVCIVLCVVSSLAGQNAPGGPNEQGQFEELAQRYAAILKSRPQRGTAFDQWYRHYLDAGRLDELAAKVEREAKESPNDLGAQLIAGLVYERRGREDAAIEAFTCAESLAPDNYLPPYLRGTLLAQQSRFAEAAAALVRAIALEPPRAELLEIYKRLGRLYLRQGRMREAMATWSEIVDKFPGDRQVLEELAELLGAEDQLDEAIRRWEQVAALAKDDPFRQLLARVEIAQLQARSGKTKDAVTQFDQTLEQVDPDSWLARDIEQRIEEIFQQAVDPAGLVAYYESRLQRRPDDLNGLVRLAAALARSGNAEDALTRYRSAVRLAPGRRDIREALIRELVRSGSFPEAITECEQLADRNPDAPDLLRMLGQLHLDAASPAGRAEAELKAIEIWKRIAAIRPNDPALAVQVAEICRHAAARASNAVHSSPLPLATRVAGAEGHAPLLATAEEFYREAVRRAPAASEYHEYLGEFLHGPGRKADAIAAWARLAAPPLDTAENWHRLAEIYARFDCFDEAVAAGEKSIELLPDNFEYRVSQIQRLLKKQETEKAVEQLAHLDRLADDPLLEEKALARRVEVLVAANRADAEIKRLQSSLQSDGSSVKAHWTLALLLAQKHRFTEASKSLEFAERLAPRDARLVKARAAILEQAGNTAEAVEQYRKLVELEPRSRSSHLEKIVRSELELGHGHRARDAADALILASPSNVTGYRLRAEVAFRLHDPATGLDALRQAVRIAPRDLELRLELARSLGEQRKLDEAMEHYWRAFEIAEPLSDKLAIVSAMTDLSAAVGRLDRVVDHLRELRRRRDDVKGLTLCLVESLRRAGDVAGARRELTNLLATRRDDLDVLSQLVALAESSNDWGSALTYQQQLVALLPDRANLESLARLYTQQGNEAEASKIWKRILTETEDASAWLAAVDRQLQHSNLAEALQLAELGLARQPDDWRLLYRAAIAQLGLGRPDPAQRIFARILSQPQDTTHDGTAAAGPGISPSAQLPRNVPAQGGTLPVTAGQFRLRMSEFNDVVVARSAFVRFLSLQAAAGQSAMPGGQARSRSLSGSHAQQIQQMQARQQQEAAYRQQLQALQSSLAQLQKQSAQQQQVQAIQAQIRQVQQAIHQLMQTGPMASSLPTDQRSAKIESAIALFVLEHRAGRIEQWKRATLDVARTNPEFHRYYLLAHLSAGNEVETQLAISQVAEALPDDPLPHVARICLLEGRPNAQPAVSQIKPDELEAVSRSVAWLATRAPQLRADLTYTYGYLLLRAGRTDEAARLVQDLIDSAEQPQDLGLLPDLVPRLGEPALEQKLLARVAELAGQFGSLAAAQYIQFALETNFLFASDDEYIETMLKAFEQYVEVVAPQGTSVSLVAASSAPTRLQARNPASPARPQNLFVSRCLDPDLLALLDQLYFLTNSAGKLSMLRDRLGLRASSSDGAVRQAYVLATACIDWWSGERDTAVKSLEKLSEEPASDPWVRLSLAHAHFDLKDFLRALASLNRVRVTSGILAADVDELRTQIVQQLSIAGDRELILRGLMVELERQTGEPQLSLFFESPQPAAASQNSAGRPTRNVSPARAPATRKTAMTSSGMVTYQPVIAPSVRSSNVSSSAQNHPATLEFRVQLPITELLAYAKAQQKLGDVLRRAEAQWDKWPQHSQLGALVALARFAADDIEGAGTSVGRWAGDANQRQEHFANAEAWMLASACLREKATHSIGREIAQHVMRVAAERGRSTLEQSVLILIDWTRACVAEGELAEAERVVGDWADAVEQAALASIVPVSRTSGKSPQVTQQEWLAVHGASTRVATAYVLAGVSDKLPPALLPALVRQIRHRIVPDIDRVNDPLRIVRPVRDAIRTALPELPEEARKRLLEDLLGLLFPNGLDRNLSMYVPAGGGARGVAGVLAQAVIDVAHSTGDLERLRSEWDKHPLAQKSRTIVALRAAAADSLGDQQAAEKLLTQLGAQRLTSFDPNVVTLVPATAPKRSYGPEQALGPPDTPNPGDQPTAWASSTPDGQDEWLILEFPQAIVPTNVKVYENCSPGAVVKVSVFKQDGEEVDAWSGADPIPMGQASGISVIPMGTDFKTNRVKLYIDSKKVRGWNEVDAVGLVDASGNVHWASAAAASSVYGQRAPNTALMVTGSGGMVSSVQQRANWGTEQVLGPPDTPESGDRPTAWTSNSPDGQDEWLVLEFPNAVAPKSVKVYETFNPGAVTRVSVFKDDGTEVEAWSGLDPTPRGIPKGVSVIPIQVDFKVKRLRLTISSKDVPGWNEFDAVGLVDESGQTQWASAATASTTYGQATPAVTQLAQTGTTPGNSPLELLQRRVEQAAEEKRRSDKKQAELEEKVRQLTEELQRVREQLKQIDPRSETEKP